MFSQGTSHSYSLDSLVDKPVWWPGETAYGTTVYIKGVLTEVLFNERTGSRAVRVQLYTGVEHVVRGSEAHDMHFEFSALDAKAQEQSFQLDQNFTGTKSVFLGSDVDERIFLFVLNKQQHPNNVRNSVIRRFIAPEDGPPLSQLTQPTQDEVDFSFSAPSDMICPLGRCIMKDPVVLHGSGNIYDQWFISRWLANNDTDPVYNTRLLIMDSQGKQALIKSFAHVPMLKRLIEEWLAEQRGQNSTGEPHGNTTVDHGLNQRLLDYATAVTREKAQTMQVASELQAANTKLGNKDKQYRLLETRLQELGQKKGTASAMLSKELKIEELEKKVKDLERDAKHRENPTPTALSAATITALMVKNEEHKKTIASLKDELSGVRQVILLLCLSSDNSSSSVSPPTIPHFLLRICPSPALRKFHPPALCSLSALYMSVLTLCSVYVLSPPLAINVSDNYIYLLSLPHLIIPSTCPALNPAQLPIIPSDNSIYVLSPPLSIIPSTCPALIPSQHCVRWASSQLLCSQLLCRRLIGPLG